jgi:hypothetical protein
LAAVALVAAGIGGQLLAGDDQSKPRTNAQAAERGSACPLLAQAAQLSESANQESFRSIVREAAHVAERALHRSGLEFGKPEHLAIQLSYDVRDGRADAVTVGLQKSAAACSTIGRWPSNG